jgi:hypothetical protein
MIHQLPNSRSTNRAHNPEPGTRPATRRHGYGLPDLRAVTRPPVAEVAHHLGVGVQSISCSRCCSARGTSFSRAYVASAAMGDPARARQICQPRDLGWPRSRPPRSPPLASHPSISVHVPRDDPQAERTRIMAPSDHGSRFRGSGGRAKRTDSRGRSSAWAQVSADLEGPVLPFRADPSPRHLGSLGTAGFQRSARRGTPAPNCGRAPRPGGDLSSTRTAAPRRVCRRGGATRAR